MKKIIIPYLVIIAIISISISCKRNKEIPEKDNKIISFNPEDTVSVNRLMQFYIDNGIILKEMLRCDQIHSQKASHSYDCLLDDCAISQDYMQDSLSGVFFTELECFSGSCGNNIYIIEKKGDNFHILHDECGIIDQDLGVDTLINNYKVLYFHKGHDNYRLFYDGRNFVSELIKQ